MCDKDNVYYDPWRDSTKAGADLTRGFYFYNITNPYDVLNGDSFKVALGRTWVLGNDVAMSDTMVLCCCS